MNRVRISALSLACAACVAMSVIAAPETKPAAAPKVSAKSVKLDASAIGLLREKAIAVAEKLATSQNAEIRANAMEACGNVSDRLKGAIAKGLTDKNQGVRTVAAMTIGKRKMKTLTADVESLLKDESGFVRAAALYALVTNGQTVDQTPLATLLLRDSSPRVRSHVAYIMGEIGNKSALGLIRHASREKIELATEAENKAFQLQLSEAMVKLGDGPQVDSIRAALYGGPEELETTALAAQILGQLGDRGAIAHLTNMAMYKDKAGNRLPADVEMCIATALCRLGETDAARLGLDHLTDTNVIFRKQAAAVLGASGDADHLPALQLLLDDPEETVQIAAADAILKITEKRR